MQWLRPFLKRALANGWGRTAGLVLTLLVVSTVVDSRFNGSLELRSPPWSLLVVFAGVLVLNTGQEALLALVFLLVELQHDLAMRLEPWGAGTNALFLRRSLILLVCIWAAQVRSRLNQQRRQLESSHQELARKLSQSLQASAMAHELRQPLSQLLLQTRLVQYRAEQGSALSPPLEEALKGVLASAEQLNRLVAAISQLLKPSPSPNETVDLAAVVNGCVKQISPQLRHAVVDLHCSGLERPLLITGQQQQLAIACSNLLNNAIEALDQQAPPRQLAIRLHEQAGQAVLVVSDNGPGLPSTQLRDLLMGSAKAEGMGVGLLTVQSIAQRHGGALRLGQSEELGGAEVELSLLVQ